VRTTTVTTTSSRSGNASRSIEAVRCGLDVLLSSPARLNELRGARVGLLAHAASVTALFEHAIEALARAGVQVVRLFGPEHGIRGEAQDMIAVGGAVDPISRIPTVSLYGTTLASLTPRQDDLRDLDVMLIDLQDVGARYYTYVYTAMLAAEACTAAGVRVLVLDRPNPLGGPVEGPPMQKGFDSFVGMLSLPTRHGLTLAEVLQFARSVDRRTLSFDVVEVEGWRRDLWMDGCDAPWVMPSPNMPTLDTAMVYPGLCLLEGTNASEGRGTTRPFELFGAPYVDPPALRLILDRLALPGVAFRLASFQPTFQKWAGQRCGGLQIHVTDRDGFLPVRTGLAIVWALRQHAPHDFAWRSDAYEFVDTIPAIDLLFGGPQLRELVDQGAPFERVLEASETPHPLRDAVDGVRRPAYAAAAAQ